MKIRSLVALVVALALSQAPLAQSAALKLATVVPDGSIWDKNLKQMAAEVEQGTGGRVTITVFSGGSQGDEPAVLRKMRLNSLDAALFTVIGLGNIDGAFNVFNIPFFYASYDELYAVVEKLTPILKERLDAKGFVFLNWGHGGWLQVFSKQPIRTLADLKRAQLWSGGESLTQWYKANGFNSRALAFTDILMGLTTGMVDAVPMPPIAVMAYQWNKQAPYMLDIGLMPVAGAMIVNKRVWTRMSEADRTALAESARAVEARLNKDVPNQDKFAIALMANLGLTVTKAEGQEWKTEGDKLAATMRGQMVPRDIFDLALKERDAFRAQRKAASSAGR